jgi:hypothetical protein
MCPSPWRWARGIPGLRRIEAHSATHELCRSDSRVVNSAVKPDLRFLTIRPRGPSHQRSPRGPPSYNWIACCIAYAISCSACASCRSVGTSRRLPWGPRPWPRNLVLFALACSAVAAISSGVGARPSSLLTRSVIRWAVAPFGIARRFRLTLRVSFSAFAPITSASCSNP